MAAAPEQGVMLDTALQLSEQGFHVIPLGDPFSAVPVQLVKEHGGDIDKARYAFCKKARIQWQVFQQVAPTEQQIAEWWTKWPHANIGIITGINVVVADGDTPEACAFLDSGKITRTPWKVKTARGYHFYFRNNPSLILKNSAAGGLDMRGAGGYVVAPGSTSGDFQRYEWQVDMAWGADAVSDLPMLSAQDVSALFSWRGNSQPMNEVGEATGDVLAHLGGVKLPHDGTPADQGSRNNKLASMVGTWFRAGLSFETVNNKAMAFGASCVPPMRHAEVMSTVSSIAATHRKNSGGEIPVMDEEEQAAHAGFRVSSFDEWISSPPVEPEMFWGDRLLFRQARVLIAGKPKHGKSQFAIDMGMAAACGSDFLGMNFDRPVRFLWMQAEIHEAFVFERIATRGNSASSEERALIGKNFMASSRCDFDLFNEMDLWKLRKMIEQHQPDILCFDPIINFSSAEENDNTEVRKLLRRIDAIGSRFNCAIVLLHHTRKELNTVADFDSIRGASAFRGWYDSGVILGGSKDALTVAYELRNGPSPLAHGVQYDAGTGRYSVTDLAETQADSQDTDSTGKRPSRTGGGARTEGHDRDHDRDRETRLAKAMMIINERPGIMSGELTMALTRMLKIGERTAESVISDLRKSCYVRIEKVGKNNCFYAKSIAENDPFEDE